MRLIDAEPIEIRYNTETLGRREMYEMVKNAPTIDAVPVVRCKDCKWKANTIGDSWCDFHEFTILSDDDFCSYGERKDHEID